MPDAPMLPPDLDVRAIDAYLRQPLPEAPWLHGEVARRMGERLSIIKMQPSEVLDWWSGRGGSQDVLRSHCAAARVTPVEPAQVLASAAAPKPRWWSPARWMSPSPVARSDTDASADGQAQMVWANMMLHWADDPRTAMARWHRALGVDGFVMFSCLGPDTLRELRELYERRGWGPPMRGLTDMHDLGDMLVEAGFADPVMDMERITLSWRDPAALLAELRTLGRNAHAGRMPGWRTPAWRRALGEELSSLATGGHITMTFEIIYGHAFKPVPKARVTGQTQVSLEDMRAMVRAPRPGR